MINNNDFQTFIFIHDQDIILYYEEINKFKSIGDYKYVFLGGGKIDKLNKLNNILIARDLLFNLEEYPNMCAYSGWYVLYKNNLITKKYVNLLEYDIIIVDDFIERMIEIVNKSPDISLYGFKPFNINNCFLFNSNLRGKLNQYYPDLHRKINNKCILRGINLWSTTSNCTMKNDFFYRYMNDSNDIFLWMKNEPSVGHELERNLSIYQIMHDDIDILYVNNLLNHFQLDSHKTQGVFNENYIEILKNNHELLKL